MQSVLADIVSRLEAKQFPNEQALKQGVVLRLLDVLGWDIYDPKTIWPEFSVNGGHVDFALCQPFNKPQIFIEVKQSSTFNIGEDQLMMKYAFQHGVPIAILTDGQKWSFYLPSGNGSFEERRFYHLDLLERDASEVELRLHRYLSFDEVRTNRAFEAARSDHDDASRRREIAAALPAAWKEMVEDADERLVSALLAKVESSTGYRPQEDEIANYIRQQGNSNGTLDRPKVIKKIERKVPANAKKPVAPQAEVKLVENGTNGENWYSINKREPIRNKKAVDTTVEAFRELAKTPQFLDAVELEMLQIIGQRKRKVSKRRWLARSREELYANPKFYSSSAEVAPGWWLGTHYSNADKRDMLDVARKVAIKFGLQLDFYLV